MYVLYLKMIDKIIDITIDLNVMYYIYFKLLANQFFAVHPHLYIKIFA